MKHQIPDYLEDLKQVANDIADMPYDKVAYFLYCLQHKIEKDSESDQKGGRYFLANQLKKAALEIEILKERFIRIWGLCAKHMPKN